MLTRPVLLVVLQLLRIVPLPLARLHRHLHLERVLRVHVVRHVRDVRHGVVVRPQVARRLVARQVQEASAVDSARPLDREVAVEHEDVVQLGGFWPFGRDKVRVADDEPLGAAVVQPAAGSEPRLVRSPRGIAPRHLEEAGLALEAATRCEGQGEGRELEELAEPIRLGSEDLAR